jgi:IPT/TIG domain
MMMRIRQALIALGACTLLIGGVSAVIQSPPASATGGKTPTITKVSPSKGTTSGNTVVTITGTNLAGASLVTFGTRAKADIVVASSTKLTVIDPSLGTGPEDVIVTLANGHTSPLSRADRFTYVTAPGKFPSSITGTFTDSFTYFDDDGALPPAETSTTGSFTLNYVAPSSCPTEATDGLDAACYGATSVTGTGLQACYPPDNSSPTLEPFTFGTDAIHVTARIQVDAAGVYHLYFDFFASSAAGGPVKCPALDHDQNSGIALFHDPDGKDTASPDAYAVGQRSESVNVQDNGEDQDFGNGITAPGWSGSATFAFAYGSSPVVSGSPAGGTVGTPYLDKSIAVSGGTSPYTVTATGLPPGLTIKSSGTITGTPTAAGTYTPTITATDSSKPPRAGAESPTIVIAP